MNFLRDFECLFLELGPPDARYSCCVQQSVANFERAAGPFLVERLSSTQCQWKGFSAGILGLMFERLVAIDERIE